MVLYPNQFCPPGAAFAARAGADTRHCLRTPRGHEPSNPLGAQHRWSLGSAYKALRLFGAVLELACMDMYIYIYRSCASCNLKVVFVPVIARCVALILALQVGGCYNNAFFKQQLHDVAHDYFSPMPNANVHPYLSDSYTTPKRCSRSIQDYYLVVSGFVQSFLGLPCWQSVLSIACKVNWSRATCDGLLCKFSATEYRELELLGTFANGGSADLGQKAFAGRRFCSELGRSDCRTVVFGGLDVLKRRRYQGIADVFGAGNSPMLRERVHRPWMGET